MSIMSHIVKMQDKVRKMDNAELIRALRGAFVDRVCGLIEDNIEVMEESRADREIIEAEILRRMDLGVGE